MSLTKTACTFLVALGLCCLCATSVFAEYLEDEPPGIPLHMDIPTAYVLSKGQLEVSAFYRTVNDTVDVFNFKESSIPGDTIGSLGDYHGLQGIFHFALREGLQISYEGERRELGLGRSRGDVEIASHDVMLKQRLVIERSWYPTVALGAFYRGNRSENIVNPRLPLLPQGTITFGGIKDDSYGMAIFASKEFSTRWTLHALGEYSRTNVNSEFGIDPAGLGANVLMDFANILEESDYHSDNFTIGFGGAFQITPKFMVSADYKRIQVIRSGESRKPPKAFDSNNVLAWRLSYLARSWLALSVNGSYFTNQFLGEIHSLYNATTARRFNKNYGYLGFGITVFHDFSSALFPGHRS